MKKSIISSVIALGVMGGSAAYAAPIDVTFTGGVTAKTCDIAVSPSPGVMGNTVDLGVVGQGQTGQPVTFALTASNATTPECASLSAQETAEVMWLSSKMDGVGLGMTSGDATGSRVLLTSVNAKDAQVSINSANTSAAFEANKVIGDGFKFEAKLQGGQVPGKFQSVASVQVLYK
ncbi:hypothetical protein [Yersinia similis]|uniref:hypothetical protein n=1 Tax=Yersinia similis TaxID=367190 RepID=UPI0005E328FB|nr:hypothetical protein [Yersinia similis]CNC45768.1 fimbrial protein PefA [Yersinia similis]CNE33205.1 fimbrial protein PefA [Yersinia similis]